MPTWVGPLRTDAPLWGYPAATFAATGAARLRTWPIYDRAGEEHGYLAMVTELGLGASITTAAEQIWARLEAAYRARCEHEESTYLVLLEHYPADQDPIEGGHLDQVTITAHGPRWRRIWPTSETNPNHQAFEEWMTEHGQRLLTDHNRHPARARLAGPHCSHDECSMHTCDHTGYVEHTCATPDCPLCGAPSPQTPERWGSDPQRYAAMSPVEQARVQAYWQRYPLIRRHQDPALLPEDRLAAEQDTADS